MPKIFCWCLHCERVFRAWDWEQERRCPHCYATERDIFDWDKRKENWSAFPDYPDVPEVGKRYPLYPEQGKGGEVQ